MKKHQNNHLPADSFFNSFPQWLRISLVCLLSGFTLFLPVLYDKGVPEVAGDIRWTLIHLTGLIGFLLIIVGTVLTHRKINFSVPPIVWAVIALSLFITFSAIDALNPLRASFFLQHWLGYISLFFLFFWVRDTRFQKILPWLLVLPLGFNALIGIFQYHNFSDERLHNILSLWPYPNFFIDWTRQTFLQSAVPGATFANKNLAASYSVLLWPIAAYLALTSPQLWKKALSSLILFLTFTFLIYSRSRASWIAFTIALVLGIIFALSHKEFRTLALSTLKYKFTFPLAILTLVGTLYFGNMLSPLQTHGIAKPASEQLKTLSRFDSNEFGPRLAYNLNGIEIIKDFPINGTGIGTFHTIYPKYHNARYSTPRHGYNVTARPQRAHNDVMQMFIEIGILGGITFVSLWVFALIMTLKLSKPSIQPQTHHKTLPFFLFVGITGLCINSLADFPLQMPTAPALLFALLGFLTALYLQSYPRPAHYIFQKHEAIKQSTLWAISALLLFSTYYIAQENYARRQGAFHLKKAMQRMQANIIDRTTLSFIDTSYNIYPYNSRLLEFRAIAYQNFHGKPGIPAQIQENITREALKIDPYAANHHINIANMYLMRAQQAKQLKDSKAFYSNINKAKEELSLLEILAPFSHFTFGVEGSMYLLLEDYNKAQLAYNRALIREPSFSLAKAGLKVITEQLKKQR